MSELRPFMRYPAFDLIAARQASGFWYVGTPYTDYPLGLEAAAIYAALLTGLLFRHGIQAYSPIAHCHWIAIHLGIDPKNGRFWMQSTASIRRQAHGLIVVEMATWERSRGLTAEREQFEREGKPVYALNRVALRGLVMGLQKE